MGEVINLFPKGMSRDQVSDLIDEATKQLVQQILRDSPTVTDDQMHGALDGLCYALAATICAFTKQDCLDGAVESAECIAGFIVEITADIVNHIKEQTGDPTMIISIPAPEND
jgi:hypothetical protein